MSASVCEDGSIELHEGAIADSYSLVEACNSGKWVSVCDSEWTLEDLAVICHQAGYTRYGMHYYVVLCNIICLVVHILTLL